MAKFTLLQDKVMIRDKIMIKDRIKLDCWRVEAFDDDGRCHIAIFAGPEAKPMAEEYSKWKYGVVVP